MSAGQFFDVLYKKFPNPSNEIIEKYSYKKIIIEDGWDIPELYMQKMHTGTWRKLSPLAFARMLASTYEAMGLNMPPKAAIVYDLMKIIKEKEIEQNAPLAKALWNLINIIDASSTILTDDEKNHLRNSLELQSCIEKIKDNETKAMLYELIENKKSIHKIRKKF